MANEQIIVRREAEEEHDDHHGGGWKVAYADFMTAMMAFFLMLWILNASDREKLEGIARYFTPTLSYASGGGPDLLDGQTLEASGSLVGGSTSEERQAAIPTFGQERPLAIFDSRLRYEAEPEVIVEFGTEEAAPGATEGTAMPGAASAEPAAQVASGAAAAQADDAAAAALDRAEADIAAGLAELAADSDLAGHLQVARTPEGLEMQIVDLESGSMFEIGSATIGDSTRELLRIVGDAVAGMPNKVIISGHTDARQYSGRGGYGNWELSVERANATRRTLIENGLAPDRIARVSGLADTDPLNPDDPQAPENRRISVLLVK
ncbi:OmpA/MotB protein [Roseivivax marinus]|uniref:OmpA/MotB protein n=1 Tax=Roseivivax marinus TaxID=1379903 RepID=W4HH70_9RHOB|nr:flagellar motor protein MotB [Roseivivax marinus]ETW11486.1 OmpA/MotB protein [Roseivivax marinus]